VLSEDVIACFDKGDDGLGQFPRQVCRVWQVDSGAFRTAGDMILC
jgi:hypothetical protein